MLKKLSREELLAILKNKNWETELAKIASTSRTKIDVIWAANDLAKDGKINEAMKIARFYALDEDPSLDDNLNKRTIKGEDTRVIDSVRGSLCWLLQSIIVKLEPAYYSDILDILEGKDSDDEAERKLRLATGDNIYVRQQATVPLEILAANMRAIRNADGTPFAFGEENKNRTEALAFRILEENREYPRVLEYLSSVFDKIRYLKEDRAEVVLKSFFYNYKTGELNPDYVTDRVAHLAIYFAEFREAAINDNFNSSYFKSFLRKLIQDATPRLKQTIAWLFWQVCKENIKHFEKVKDYISLFFEGPLNRGYIAEICFLIETIVDKYPSDAVTIFKKVTGQIRHYLDENGSNKNDYWLHFEKGTAEKFLGIESGKLKSIIDDLKIIRGHGLHIFDLEILLEEDKPERHD